MPAKLIVSKRILTQYCNKLDKIISQFKEEELHTLNTSGYNQRLEEAIGTLEAASSKVEHMVQEYASLYSTLNQPDPKESEDFEEYVSKAEFSLSTAFDYGLMLQARSRALKAGNDMTSINAHACISIQAKKLELPTLPIPSFGGDIWEWDNFWEPFNYNIHSQDLPELYKFNYLLNALEGEARESVKRFQITNGNYMKAVDFLRQKYGNRNELIHRLIERFEQCFPRSSSLKDQRPLLEQLQAIVSQLERKGENVDNQWMQKQVLSKFPIHIQRSVLTKKQALDQQAAFLMQDLLKLIDEVLACEEMVFLHTKETRQVSPLKVQGFRQEYLRVCMYCGKNHKSILCPKYSTPKTRSEYLREHHLCLICASPQHTTVQCMKRKCFNCQGLHHTSCCFKRRVEKPSIKAQEAADQEQRNNRRIPRQANAQSKFTKKVNHLTHEIEDITNDAVVYEARSTEEGNNARQATFLPTGEVTVSDQERNILRKVCVLFDTGAEISFIDKTLADDLHLPIIPKEKVRLRTFGSEQVQKKICHVVQLKAWDMKGDQITIDLLTYDIISKCLETPPLSSEDIKHLYENHIPLDKLGNKKKAKPQILLGCDKLWAFINEDKPQLRLPSGLRFIETRLGYLITGQLKQLKLPSTNLDHLEEDKWDGYWSLDTQINAVSIAEDDSEDEQERWEKFWSLDAAGTERIGQSESAEQAQTDKLVLQHFIETGEKRGDGYSVRLPWMEHVTDLPENSLREDPDITFEETSTTLVEIDSSLNTRPLVYMDSDSCNETIIRPVRPVDFVHKVILDYRLDQVNLQDKDPPCFLPEEQIVLPTKSQTIQALENTYKSANKFWNFWRTQYLTALRGKHKLQVGLNKSISHPQEDDCVLITDPVQRRHSWKRRRIKELLISKDEQERKAVMKLQSEKQIRRQVNLLVPLELEDRSEAETQQDGQASSGNPIRYQMRPRNPKDYDERNKYEDQLKLLEGRNQELPLVEANEFATEVGLSKEDRAIMKMIWFFTGLLGEDILDGLSEKDMAAIEEVVSTTSGEESLAELAKKSPDLAAKLKNLFDLGQRQFAEVKPEGQEFFKNTYVMWKSKFFDKDTPFSLPIAEELTLGFIKKFNALSDDVKEDIKKHFPALTTFLTSEETAKRLQEH